MKTAKTSVWSRLCSGVSIAILALSLTFGAARTALANEVELLAPTPQEMVVAPILKAMNVLVERIARLEESVTLFTATVNSQRVATRQLCVSDESGAETCISKAQLDGLIKRFAQAEVSEPAVIVAIAVPAAEPQATEAPVTDDPVAEGPLNETTTTAADAIETIPAREVYASAAGSPSEPTFTGSTLPDTDGAALVWHPEVEITIVESAAPEWAAPAEE